MRKNGLSRLGIELLTLTFVLSFGLLMSSPMELSANPEDSENIALIALAANDGAAQEPDDIAGPSENAEPAENAESAETEEPDGLAGASEHVEAYEPLPVKPITREVNNGLLGSGLGASVLLIGGAFVMDRRKK